MSVIADYFVEILLSTLSLSFALWAWTVRSGLSKGLAMLGTLNERLIKLVENHESLKSQFADHSRLQWHRKAGEEINRLQARVDALERNPRQ